MEVLIIFDSNFGNTKKVADHMAAQIGSAASSISVNDFKESNLQGVKLLIVGSPINAWRPTKKIKAFLDQLEPRQMAGVNAAAFDTRVRSAFSGNAAKRIVRALQSAGATVIGPPMGFYVKANQGPLAEGELKKAEDWILLIRSQM